MNNETPFFSDTELRDLLDRISSFTYPELPFALMTNKRLGVIQEATRAKGARLLHVGEDLETLLCCYRCFLQGKYFVRIQIPHVWEVRRMQMSSLESECLVNRKTIHVGNISKQGSALQNGVKVGRRGSIHTPVIVDGKPWGILEIFGNTNLGWDDTVEKLLEEAANGFGVIIKNEAEDSPWLRETGLVPVQDSRDLEALASISLGFVARKSYNELDLLLRTVSNERYEAFGPIHTTFFPCTPQDDGIVLPNVPCVFEDGAAWRAPLECGKFHSLAEHHCLEHLLGPKHPFVCEDTAEDPVFSSLFRADMVENVRSCIAAPIRQVPESILGILLVAHKDPGFFREKDAIFFQHAADIMGMGIAQGVAEEELAKSQELLQTIQSTTLDGMVMIDLEYNIIWHNRYVMQSRGNIVGKKCYEAFEERDGPCKHCVHAQVVRDGEAHDYESTVTEKDGRMTTWWVRAIPMRDQDGKVCAILETGREITGRKKAEDALRESEEKFAKAFRSSPNLMVISRVSDGLVVEVSDSFMRVMGYDRLELVGKPVVELNMWKDSEDRSRFIESISQHGEVHGFEARMRTKSRGTRWVLLAGESITLNNEEHTIFVGSDITDRKKAEKEKLALERQVQHIQKLESLGVLAGGIAHDFNNLLMGILGNADLALLELSPVAPARENVREIAKAAHRAADLARQMLAYSGKGVFVVTPVDLSEVVTEMGHLLVSSVSKTTLLKYDFEENAP
ncbi:PAS domain S-box protein, partial [Candidatus Hydrogenedentota bacterium]